MKSTFLMVMGIIMTVLGAIGTIGSLMALMMFMRVGVAELTLVGVMAIIQTVLILVAGVIGIRSSNDKHKAAGCIIWAIIIIIVEIVALIIQNVSGYMELAYLSSGGTTTMSSALSIPLSFVLPVLYLIAALLFVRKEN